MSPKQQVLWWEFHENETVTLDRATELVGGDIYCNRRFYVGQILKRMIDNGWIERVGRGVYKKAAESAKKTGPAVGGIKCAGTSSAVMPSMREWALKHGIINETATP